MLTRLVGCFTSAAPLPDSSVTGRHINMTEGTQTQQIGARNLVELNTTCGGAPRRHTLNAATTWLRSCHTQCCRRNTHSGTCSANAACTVYRSGNGAATRTQSRTLAAVHASIVRQQADGGPTPMCQRSLQLWTHIVHLEPQPCCHCSAAWCQLQMPLP
jgi:hypothetical protein